jgi:transcriptional regulator with XRE-family HTH domain
MNRAVEAVSVLGGAPLNDAMRREVIGEGTMRGAEANGPQIQAARLDRRLTIEQLAARAGVDVKTVRKAERGERVDLSTLTRLSFSLDVDVANLIVTSRSRLELELRRRDAVRRWHHGWEMQDTQALLSLYDDDAVLHLPGAPDIPFAGEHRGRLAIHHAYEIAWNTCPHEPMYDREFSLIVSENTLVLGGDKSLRHKDGYATELWVHQIFTFRDDSPVLADHRVEFDTLKFARFLQLLPPHSSE